MGRIRRRCQRCGELHDRDERCNCEPRFYDTPAWRRLRRIGRAGARCMIAGCGSTERLTRHHRTGRRDGGPDTVENLDWLCGRHHSQYEGDVRADRDTPLRREVERR